MEERLLKLTQFWYEYVGCDHHKDRDCHFYINKVWSYGREPYYRVEHYGYMSDFDDDKQYQNYEDALEKLVAFLEEEVKSAYESIPHDWEDEKKWDYNYRGVMEVLKHYNLHSITFRKY